MPKAKPFVIVHRNEAGEVVRAGQPFPDEADAPGQMAAFCADAGIYEGDSLCVEREAGQRRGQMHETMGEDLVTMPAADFLKRHCKP